jgi:hypothetical protein
MPASNIQDNETRGVCGVLAMVVCSYGSQIFSLISSHFYAMYVNVLAIYVSIENAHILRTTVQVP